VTQYQSVTLRLLERPIGELISNLKQITVILLKRIKKQLLRKGSVETDDDDTGVVLDAKGNVISREDENLKLDDEFDDSVADMPDDDYEVNYESYTDDEPYGNTLVEPIINNEIGKIKIEPVIVNKIIVVATKVESDDEWVLIKKGLRPLFFVNIRKPSGLKPKDLFKFSASFALRSNCAVELNLNSLASNLSKTAFFSSLPSDISVS
jgi:hypothetical protein